MGSYYETVTETKEYNLIIPDGTIFKIWVVEGERPMISEENHQRIKNTPEDTMVTLENLTNNSSKKLRLKEVTNIIGEYYISA
ncbi:MAG: hypothetical protein AABX29_03525 [Nanoarchaeota archaeon]|mgnify:CR=1 FL=1